MVITFCPLCSTGVAFDERINGRELSFGVSGLLYDRQTNSLWSQLLGEAISSPLKGQRLTMLPLSHTSWADWRKAQPATQVLSTNTGTVRPCRRAPYNGYEQTGERCSRCSFAPPAQEPLEAAYKEQLAIRYGIVFNRLFALANMPIQRFGSQQFDGYMGLLKGAHRDKNLAGVMCKTMISVSWRGQVRDCNFNQMLGMSLGDSRKAMHLAELLDHDLNNTPIRVAGHCYGCTAGQGSSCGGALDSHSPQEETCTNS